MRSPPRVPPTIRRFALLFVVATAVLLVPTFLYLEHTAVYDPSALEWSPAAHQNNLFHPAGQVGQGHPVGYPIRTGRTPTFFEACLMNPNVRWADLASCDRARNQLVANPIPTSSSSVVEPTTTSGPAGDDATPPTVTTPSPSPSPDPNPRPKQDIVDPNGLAIMPQMGNATAKAALGRATWHFLHTMTLRYPEHPSETDKSMLRDFFRLFSLLYPCGDCANHFQMMLEQFPVQTESRKSASVWLCSMHNKVNTKLHKPQFDCAKLDEAYDCGCAPDPDQVDSAAQRRTWTEGLNQVVKPR